MYKYETRVFMGDTDATGLLYFTQSLKFALEAFETYFQSEIGSTRSFLSQGNFGLPIVHCDADFHAPLFLSDPIEVHLKLDHLGRSSFALKAKIFSKGRHVGTTKIVHVVVDKETGESMEIPAELCRLLERL